MKLFLNYQFADPWWLLALLLLPLILWLRTLRQVPVLLVPFAAVWHRPSVASASRWPLFLGLLGASLLAIALARPQRIDEKRAARSEGYDIMIAIDLSTSMLSEDFEENGEPINRLQAVTPVLKAFINDRPNDRIGIVIFSGKAYTLSPLTFDHGWLMKQVERLRTGLIEDGTAIGDGLGAALTRLEQADRSSQSQRKGAFVVLMTDGVNNRSTLSPEQATQIAKSRGIPVYTIGAGRTGYVQMPRFDQRTGKRVGSSTVLSELDENTLREMANATGGRYFAARDANTVRSAFESIDRAQKIEFQAKSFLVTTELFIWPATSALTFLGIALLLTRLSVARPKARTATSSQAPPLPVRAPETLSTAS